MAARPMSYTLEELDAMDDEFFVKEFVRITGCVTVKCCSCPLRIGENPMMFLNAMRRRVKYKKGSRFNPLGGLTRATKIIKSCDQQTKTNDDRNPGINPLYQAKRRAVKREDPIQVQYIHQGISHVCKTEYYSRDPIQVDVSSNDNDMAPSVIVPCRRRLRDMSVVERENAIVAEVQRREEIARDDFTFEREVQRRQRQLNLGYDLAEIFMP